MNRMVLILSISAFLCVGCGSDDNDASTQTNGESNSSRSDSDAGLSSEQMGSDEADAGATTVLDDVDEVPDATGAIDATGTDDATESVDTASNVGPGEDTAESEEAVTVHVTAFFGEGGTGTEDDPYHDLQTAIDEAPDGATIMLEAGSYSATSQPYADPGCGNCDDATFFGGAEATRGFYISGKSLDLKGAGRSLTVLVTNAGYGVLFDEAGTSSIKSLSVTGGIRDADGKATDAGIVVRMTELVVEDVAVVANDNLYTGPLPDPVVGIGGIFGREGSVLTVSHCIIEDNSWDGITLYRGVPDQPDTAPTATVEWCRIGANPGQSFSGGRGVGIGITWDASLVARYNVVHHYWKGIGSFGNTYVEANHNVVRDQLGWGIIASGESEMIAMNNIIARNGTTGLAAWNYGAIGVFVNNIIVGNGTSADEWVGKKTGLWYNADPSAFILSNNLAWQNQDHDACIGGYPNDTPCEPMAFDGVYGNMVVDPSFVDMDGNDWHLAAGSPAMDTGADWLEDHDGTPCDMGLYGGPDAPTEDVDGENWTP